MITTDQKITIGILALLSFFLIFLQKNILKRKKKNQLEKIFLIILGLLVYWMVCDILQLIFTNRYGANPLYFDYFVYIGVCFLPVSFFFLALIFTKTKINFKWTYCLLFVIPVISLLTLWTNDFHHLFYEHYSTNFNENIYGPWFYVHYYSTLLLCAVSLIMLMRYSIKNSGLFSKQAFLVFIGVLVPILTNVLGTIGVIQMSTYITPITFSFTVICLIFAVFRLDLFKGTPIALQRIVDRISDSYVFLGENHIISDFNKTFLTTFHINNTDSIRGKSFSEFLNSMDLSSLIDEFNIHIKNVENNEKVEVFELYISKVRKNFNIEIASIIANNQFLGILILFKDITQHIKDMQSIKDNQSMLMEQERLASLGQMIGGIAHNLKTPIMSIAGASEGLKDLVNEFDASIGNPIVTNEDYHDIAKDMREWLTKINSYTEYMSDILTAVKGQAVNLSEQEHMDFTLGELFKRVSILMKHELKQAVVYLNMSMKVDENIIINGDVNSLVQVINNMISNSIQAYNGKPEERIDLIAWKNDNNNLVISVKDYGPGLPDKVKKKLFKEMITTKGKNGTGLGLYMSYSNIRAHFGGDITVETETGKGTTFNIILP